MPPPKKSAGAIAMGEIRLLIGDRAEQQRVAREQDNSLEAWPEHRLLATQRGPDKDGRKW